MKAKYDIVIGIDPDVERSGLAQLNVDTKAIQVTALPFPLLIETIKAMKQQADQHNKSFKVYVEAGWLNHSNWHLSRYDTKQSAAAKGNSTGRNHETGRKIIEMCQHYEIEVDGIKPLRKCWHGKDGKITSEELEMICGQKIGRCNQEGRDAALIAWVMANLPIRIKPKR